MMTTKATLSALFCCTCAASAAASSNFHLDFSRQTDTNTTLTVGTLAPDTFGDRDGGRHFDDTSFIRGRTYADTLTFSDGNVSTTVQAGVSQPRDNDRSGSSSDTFQGGSQGVYVGQFYGGLGVGWEINPGDLDDDKHTADNKNGEDFLVLDFDKSVEVTELEFNYFGSLIYDWGYNRFQYTQDQVDVDIFTRTINNDEIEDTFVGTFRIDDADGKIKFDQAIAGDSLVISTGDTEGWFSRGGHRCYKEKFEYFKLRGISGTYTNGGGGGGGGGSVVPTPSAALAAFAALGMMGLRRRRH